MNSDVFPLDPSKIASNWMQTIKFVWLTIHPAELFQWNTTGKHNESKNILKELLQTLFQTMWNTVVIWYFWYDKIIVNILPHQFFNKNSIITIISISFFVTILIIVLEISKWIVLLIKFISIVAWSVIFLFVIFRIVVWYSYMLKTWNNRNTCTLSRYFLWKTTSVRF